MADARYASSAKTATTTVSGIKLLHRRKTNAEWLALGNNALTYGEFGIDTTYGIVKGFIMGGTDGSTCSWNDATPIGSIDLETTSGSPSDRTYVYGIQPITSGNHTSGYQLLTAALPSVSVEDSTEIADATFTFVSGISIDPTDPDNIIVTKASVPKVTISKDASATGEFITEITGNHETGFKYKLGSQMTSEGEINFTNPTKVALIQGVQLADQNGKHTLSAKTVTLEEGSHITFNTGTDGKIQINVDANGILSGVSGALSFAGTIDISSNKTNLDDYRWTQGVARKIIQTSATVTNNITTDDLRIHLNEGGDDDIWVTTAAAKPGDLIVYVSADMTDDTTDTAGHYCLIPSGDEEETGGTVTSIEAGEGLKTASGSSITTSGTILHRSTTEATKYGTLGVTPQEGTGKYTSTNNAETRTDDSEKYTFLNYIEFDKKDDETGFLGHVTDVRKNEVEILSRETITKIAELKSSTITEGTADFINVTETPATDTTPRNYTIKHAEISGSITKEVDSEAGDNFITSITRDKYGHITGYKYKTLVDTDTWRPLTFAGTTFSGTPSGTGLTIKSAGFTSIDVSGNEVTIDTEIPVANTDTDGLVRAAATTTSDHTKVTGYKSLTIGSLNTLTMGVGVDVNNKMYVTTYEHYVNKDTDYSDSDFAFCAIKRDRYGHIIDVTSIDVIDGNY